MTSGLAILAPLLDHIPVGLRRRPQWIMWRLEDRDGKQTKMPYCTSEQHASPTDPQTWLPFEYAWSLYQHGGFDGIGYVFSPDDPFCGIDLDGGLPEDRRRQIIDRLSSYTEWSPGGKGVHIIVRATLPGVRRRKGPIEMYERGRFFTVSGHHYPGTPETIEARQAEVATLAAEVFGPEPVLPTPVSMPIVNLDDQEIVDRAFRAKNGDHIRQLWEGNISGYLSPSEADLALANHLAFYAPDPGQLTRLMQSSGLRREKWNTHRGDRTYLEMTVAKALEGRTTFYTPINHINGEQHHRNGEYDRIVNPPTSWPAPLAPEALFGLPGDIVRVIEPHTEADPAALLVQLLVAAGNIIGRRAHFVAEADRHFLNLFTVLVGDTSKGRKGSSWGRTERLYATVDPQWTGACIQSGLSSGEGLIWHVRDPIERRDPVKDHGRVIDYETVVADPGVEDKWLLMIEPEFSRTLRVMDRDGNTLSPVIRQAWDTGNLRVLTKTTPAKATDAHISIIGHITRDELRRYLSTTEAGNGFANRFLWVCVRRSKVLPEGGNLDDTTLAPLIERLRSVVEFGRQLGEIKRDDGARGLWREVYVELSDGHPGLLGAVTSRAEAQVMRLACLYAVLDLSAVIRAEHLLAALALLDYVEESCRHIFGHLLGDLVADTILDHLHAAGPAGKTRTEIRDLLGRHARGEDVDRALGVLRISNLAWSRPEETAGRPAERWFASAITSPSVALVASVAPHGAVQ